MKGFCALALLVCVTDAAFLGGKPAATKPVVAAEKKATSPVVKKAIAVTGATDGPAAVLALHTQLESIAGKLNTMLNAKDGALAHAKVGPSMKVFLKELQVVLKATAADKKMAPKAALEKLVAAKAGLAGLMGDLNNRQVTLMKEDNAQRESLLLGVLMTKQKEPMDKQLEILKADDFLPLEVAKALIAKHDAKLPLYVQAAAYLDAHPNRKSAPVQAVKPGNPLAKIQAMLESRLSALQHEFGIREKIHKKKSEDYAVRMKKASKYLQHSLAIREKREDRQYKKWSIMRKHDISAMSEAVDGVKKGDMKAVQRAKTALEDSMKAMKSQTESGFLYLIQMGHRLMKRDCPYCAAQCVDKCHTAGKPYVTCLTDCADAGK